jgi:hypothetical protein
LRDQMLCRRVGVRIAWPEWRADPEGVHGERADAVRGPGRGAVAVGEGRGRIYQVVPTGPFEDDANLTD